MTAYNNNGQSGQTYAAPTQTNNTPGAQAACSCLVRQLARFDHGAKCWVVTFDHGDFAL